MDADLATSEETLSPGFFEFDLQSDDRTFVVTAQLLSAAMPESEARTKVAQLWELYFGAPEVIRPGSTHCIDFRSIEGKPEGALNVARGNEPLLLWKSDETAGR
jgi:hypothetical protein